MDKHGPSDLITCHAKTFPVFVDIAGLACSCLCYSASLLQNRPSPPHPRTFSALLPQIFSCAGSHACWRFLNFAATRLLPLHTSMDSPSSARSSPSKALNPLSPERMNQQAIPDSPSSLSDALRSQRKHNRGLSDVQSRVAYLNTLSRGGSPGAAAGSTSNGGVAALQRAILGREEAESALSRVNSQFSEAQSRERRISERLESLLEELQATKERQAHERVVFEKEIRKVRKEAFRAGSALVKTQEELKHVRAEAKNLSQEVQSERDFKEKAKQEAFERAYAIAGLTEELEEVKGRLRTVEANNHAITLQNARAQELKRQDIGRMSLAEGDLALIMTPSPRRPKRPADETIEESAPDTTEDLSEEETPPKKAVKLSDPLPPQYTQQFKESPPLTVQELVDRLQHELRWEKRDRQEAEANLEFMQVQCMFKVCNCRELERQENEARAQKEVAAAQNRNDHGQIEDRGVLEIAGSTSRQTEVESFANDPSGEFIQPEEISEGVQEREFSAEIKEEEPEEQGGGEPLITFSPVTGTFRTVPSPSRPSPQRLPRGPTPHDLQASPTRSQSRLDAHMTSASPVPQYEPHPHELLSESISQSKAHSRDVIPGAHPSSMAPEAQDLAKDGTHWDVENMNEIHNVKRIPLRDDDDASDPFAMAPGTPVSREHALAQIRARRGRTSANNRSASSSDAGFRAGGLNITPARAARRIPGVQHTEPRGDGIKKNRRDMSAPMRIFR